MGTPSQVSTNQNTLHPVVEVSHQLNGTLREGGREGGEGEGEEEEGEEREGGRGQRGGAREGEGG